MAGGCRCLDRSQHVMARDRVVEGGAEVGPLVVVAREVGECLRDVRGGPVALRGRPSVLLWPRQNFERIVRAVSAAQGQRKELRLAASGCDLQVAVGAVDLPKEVSAAGGASAV